MPEPPSKLTFGVMCTGTEFEDWQADCIEELRGLAGVTLEVLIVDDRPDATVESRGWYPNVLGSGTFAPPEGENGAFWRLYRELFGYPACLSKTDLSSELAAAERIRCRVRADGDAQYFSEDDVRRIEAHDLDFVLQFAFGPIRGDILDVPEYGVWSFHHDDAWRRDGAPPCFWEIYDGEPVIRTFLKRRTDRPERSTILREGYFSTNRFSHTKNLDSVCYGTTEWPAQVAADVLDGNGEYVDRPPSETAVPSRSGPSPHHVLIYNLKRGYSLGSDILDGIDNWNIGVLRTPIQSCTNDAFDPEINWFPRQRTDGFIADPFPITIDDTTYVFVEDLSYRERKGKISYIEYPHGFENGELRTAHEEPFHLSYPYLFEHDGETYATPETHEANEIRLYRVVSPSEWEVETTLVSDVAGIDPTVIEHDGRWWLFHTTKDYDNTKLYLRYADTLTGDWKPHDDNPIRTDVRAARPGGTPFVDDGTLYRPAQYSAGEYGRRVVVNRIDELTPDHYAEETVCELRPTAESPYPNGMHTLSSRGTITLVDGKRKVRNGFALPGGLRRLSGTVRGAVPDFR